jgi:dimethylglycine dehydrogenase
VPNFWLATGTGIGIAQGPGCGRFLAQQMIYGDAEINMLGMDPRRYGPFCDQDYASAKAHREYWDMYRLVPPGEERMEGRPAKASPLHPVLAAKGCIFGEGFGWERPKWFPPAGVTEEDPTFRRTNAFPVVAEECRAVRERVGIMELPSFATYLVAGADAHAVLERVFANRMPRRDGGVVLAHALSDQGRFLTEATITRLPGDRFLVLSGAYAHQQDLDMLRWAVREGDAASIEDVPEAWTTIIVAGPRARDVLAWITEADLSNAAFPWLSCRETRVAGQDVVAIRVNYVGELGWELHVPMESAVAVYEAVWAAGTPYGIADFGLYAMNSLRLEKGYAGWGAELTAEITPAEAGMLRFVRFDHEFRGRAALEARVAEGAKTHLVELAVDATDYDPRGGEPVYAGDTIVGVTTSGGYGHATGSSYAFAYLDNGSEAAGTALTVALLGERRAATVLAEPPYDPGNERLRA